MRRIRVSIAGLLVGIALAAVSFAALLHPSALWGNTFYSLAAGWLTVAVLGAVYSRGRRRASFVGFAACGWAYFLAVFGPDPIGRAQDSLVTTGILEIIYPLTLPRGVAPVVSLTPSSTIVWAGGVPTTHSGEVLVSLTGAFEDTTPTIWQNWTTPNRFIAGGPMMPLMYARIGHSIFCLLFAQLGSLATRRFLEVRDREAVG